MIHQVMTPEEWASVRDGEHSTVSTRGRTLAEVGYLHAARPDQLEGVIERHYGDCAELVVLTIDQARLDVEVRVEPAADGTGEYPHLYGPLPLAAVVGVEVRR